MSQLELTEQEDRAVAAFVRIGFSVAEAYCHAGLALKWVDQEAAKLGETERDLFKEMMEAMRR